mmetsp:Transcript_19615/g.18947  ORF Transcript_19615/g.18947 Transcript_19615/m.18947 type:complete len:85 (+) Transcript_19615:643-897(+)
MNIKHRIQYAQIMIISITSSRPKVSKTAAKREIRNEPMMTEQKRVKEGGIEVHMNEGARAENIKISEETASCTHIPALDSKLHS